jgi:hypothetical protein
MNTQRIFDSLDVHIDFQSAEDVILLKDVYQRHGETVKILEWSNWSNFMLNEDDVAEMLNWMPNLEELELSSWRVELGKTETSPKMRLNLTKLKILEVSDCKNFMVEFLNAHLPENVLKKVKIQRLSVESDVLKRFLDDQQSIEALDISEGEFLDPEVFQSLKLKHLRCVPYDTDSPAEQRAFMKELIRSQPALTLLDTLSLHDYLFNIVDDEVFHEITECQQLATLKINIDKVPPASVRKIEKMKKLVSLLLPGETKISQEIFRQFAENFNLKSLTAQNGVCHDLNFFIETFPNLEKLSVQYIIFMDDSKIHSKLKKLDIHSNETTSEQHLSRILSCFPNLSVFKVNSSLWFSVDLIRFLSSDVKNVEILEISWIWVNTDEKFPSEIIESLKKMSKKFKHCKLSLINVQAGRRSRTIGETDFSFEPLKKALEDHFRFNEVAMCNINIKRRLEMTNRKAT